MIGVGITTHNRRDVLARILVAVVDTIPPDAPVVVAWDGPTPEDVQWFTALEASLRREGHQWWITEVVYGDRAGVAANKNRAVRTLMEPALEVDWIVLLEDDVLPLRRGWADLLVAAADASGQACMTRAPNYAEWPGRMSDGERKRSRFDLWSPEWLADELDTWPAAVDVVWNSWATATTQAIQRDAFERVGLYDEGFGLYGHEHTEWQMRLHAAGLVDRIGHPHVAIDAMEPFLVDLDVPPTYQSEFGPEWVEMIERNGGRLGELARHHHARYGA